MDRNMHHEDNEWQQFQGRKRNKLDVSEDDPSLALDFRPMIYEKFSTEQVKDLTQHLKELQKYYQFVSFQIQHQDRSISTLPKHILAMFGEVKNRAIRMVSRAKFNVDFLDSVLMPYKQLVMEAIIAERQENGEENHGSHEHGCHHSHNAITNMFFHMVREWSESPEISYIHRVIDLLGKHWQGSKRVVEGEKVKILVVGSGMGRILHQIKKVYDQRVDIQGHQSDTEKYLCGQYFLNRCHQSQPIYPYLHNFCNFLSNQDAYRCISMPATIDDHSYYYPLTLGNFQSLYLSHQSNWDVIITAFYNESIDDVLKHVRLIYRMLKEGGLWIDVSTSNIQRNIIRLTYREYQSILDNSQFSVLQKGKQEGFWYGDKRCLMNEKRTNYYRVMRK